MSTLSDKSAIAYCDYVAHMRKHECLGWEQKIKDGKFGDAELKAHTYGGLLHGKHIAYADAANNLAALEASHKELVEALRNLILTCPSNLHCDVFHHATHDRHDFTGKCPVKDRYEKSISDAGIALAKAEKLTK